MFTCLVKAGRNSRGAHPAELFTNVWVFVWVRSLRQSVRGTETRAASVYGHVDQLIPGFTEDALQNTVVPHGFTLVSQPLPHSVVHVSDRPLLGDLGLFSLCLRTAAFGRF